MTNRILIKRSSSAAAVPDVADLEFGELALNYTDGNLFYKTASNTVALIASTQTANIVGNVTVGNLISNGVVTATGNITGGNIITAGNVTANYFIGNGSQLTGVAVSTLSNGNTSVDIPSAGSNVNVTVNNLANTIVISPGSIFINGFLATPKTVTQDVEMAPDCNAVVISPLQVGDGSTITIPDTSTVKVFEFN